MTTRTYTFRDCEIAVTDEELLYVGDDGYTGKTGVSNYRAAGDPDGPDAQRVDRFVKLVERDPSRYTEGGDYDDLGVWIATDDAEDLIRAAEQDIEDGQARWSETGTSRKR